MAETDELEDSLFASILPKHKSTRGTKKESLFDLSSDDLLDLLSDEPIKKPNHGNGEPSLSNRGPGPSNREPGPSDREPGPSNSGSGSNNRGPGPSNSGPGSNNRGPGPSDKGSSTDSVMIGGYIPTISTHKTRGPLDLPSIRHKTVTKEDSVQHIQSILTTSTPAHPTPTVIGPTVTAPTVTAPPVTAPPVTAPPVTAPITTSPVITPIITPPVTDTPITTPITTPSVISSATAPPITSSPFITPPATTPLITGNNERGFNEAQITQLTSVVKKCVSGVLSDNNEQLLAKVTAHFTELHEQRLQEVMKEITLIKNEMLSKVAENEAKMSTICNELKRDSKGEDDLIEMMKEHIKQSKEEQVILLQKCEEMCTGNVKAQENYFEENGQRLLCQQKELEEKHQHMTKLLQKLEDYICQKEKRTDELESKMAALLSSFQDHHVNLIDEQRKLIESSKNELLEEQRKCFTNHKAPAGYRNEEIPLKEEKMKIEQAKFELQLERERLRNAESELNMKSVKLNEAAEISHLMYLEGQRSMEQASALEQSLQNQLKILRDHQNELHEKEKQLVKDRVISMQLRRVRGPEIHPTVSAPPDDTVIDKLEYSDSIQQLLYNIEKDDETLVKEKQFLNVLHTP